MKSSIILGFLILFNPLFGDSQTKKEKRQEHERVLDTLQQKIQGIKFADLRFSKTQVDFLINNSNSLDAQIILGIIDYFKKDLGIEVIVTTEQRNLAIKSTTSQCDFVKLVYETGTFNSTFGAIGTIPFKFSLQFCDQSIYSFDTKLRVSGLTNYANLIRNTCFDKFPLKKGYNKAKRMTISNNPIICTLNSFNKYLDSTRKNEIEGLYRLLSSEDNTSKYTVGLKENKDTINIIYFDGADFSNDWKEGELKGYMIKTLSENDYLLKWYSLDKTLVEGSVTFINKNSFELRINALGFSNSIDRFVRIK